MVPIYKVKRRTIRAIKYFIRAENTTGDYFVRAFSLYSVDEIFGE